MPRGSKRSGGQRAGRPGQAYPNRTDLPGKVLPADAPTGQAYGERKAQIEAQQAVPMAGAAQAPPAPPTGLPAGVPAPGSLPGLFADSTRPDEDIMNGARLGPGAGPAEYGYGEEVKQARDMAWAAKYLPAFEFIANSQRGGDPARQIVRLLRASLPGNND